MKWPANKRSAAIRLSCWWNVKTWQITSFWVECENANGTGPRQLMFNYFNNNKITDHSWAYHTQAHTHTRHTKPITFPSKFKMSFTAVPFEQCIHSIIISITWVRFNNHHYCTFRLANSSRCRNDLSIDKLLLFISCTRALGWVGLNSLWFSDLYISASVSGRSFFSLRFYDAHFVVHVLCVHVRRAWRSLPCEHHHRMVIIGREQ